MDYISEKISRDPVTGKLYVGKKPGDDQAPDKAADSTASGVPQPEKKGANFSVGGVDPTTKKGFLGVQPGRDPADTFSGKLANLFIPRMDKETGRLYMGTQVGRDPKRTADTAAADTAAAGTPAAGTPSAGTPAAGTPSQNASDKTAAPKLSSFGAAFKAAREARLSGKGGDTFEFGGKKYHSYQAGEKRSNASAATPAAVPAASKTSAGSPQEPPLSDKERAAVNTEKNISKTGTVTLTPAQVGNRMLDDMIAGGVKRSMGRTYDERGVIQKNPDSARFADTKVFTTTTKTPGEDSTTVTGSGGKKTTITVSGGGSTEIKRNDTRTPAEKASDEAKDKAAADAQVAAAQKRYDERQKRPGSSNVGYPVKESIANYKEAFRAVLAEAADQKFTDYDIERQVGHGLGQQYDRNNPEHKKKADALRKYHQSKGRYLLYPESINQSASRTDQAAREQAARNSQSAQAQARYSGYGYSAKRTAGGGGSRGGGGSGGGSASRGTGSPTGASAPGATDGKVLSYLKTGGRFAGALPAGLFGGWAGGKLGVATSAFLTPKDYNSKTDYPKSLPQPGPDGKDSTGKEVDTNYNAKIAAARGEYGRSATIKGSETAGQWAVGGYAIDKTMQALGSPKPATAWMPNIKKPSTILGPTVKANLARGLGTGVGVGLGQYIRNKTANTPYKDAGGLAGNVLTGAGYGYGVAGKPGAVVGGTVGLLKSATRMAADDYKSASDESRARQRSRGIARFGFNPYERQDAEVEAEKKKQAVNTVKTAPSKPESALDRVRRRDQPAGYGVLKRPQ